MSHVRAPFAAALLLLAAPIAASSQARPQSGAAATITADHRAAAIDALVRELNAGYVFPEKAAEADRLLRAFLAAGNYQSITRPADFARRLTEDLQGITKDKHLRVWAKASAVEFGRATRRTPDEQLRMARENNFGFGRTEILPGNVGYVEIESFGWWAPEARDSVGRMMSKVADTDALVIDLRKNGGGSPQAVAFVSSYLFGDAPVHLNSLYFRPENRTDHFYTDPKVPGKKFGPTKPVYVLTSTTTFSAAEEFTYNLQALGRSTTVGEATGGGAHPGGSTPIGPNFFAFIPAGRAINPITKTNWEGVGIKPEILVPRDKALDAALEAARKTKPGSAAP